MAERVVQLALETARNAELPSLVGRLMWRGALSPTRAESIFSEPPVAKADAVRGVVPATVPPGPGPVGKTQLSLIVVWARTSLRGLAPDPGQVTRTVTRLTSGTESPVVSKPVM